MNDIEITNLEVCSDCLIGIEYGYIEGIDDDTEKRCMDAIEALSTHGRYLVAAPSEDDDAGFSWKNCECCDGLPGLRFKALLVSDARLVA